MTTAARASLFLFPLLFTASNVLAAPTNDERREFFTQQRKEKADFEKKLAAESNSQNASAAEYTEKQRADRVAFMRSLDDGLQPGERSAHLNDYNAQARADLKAFRAKLPTNPKNDLEKTLEDFDKKAAADRQTLIDNLSDETPEDRAEALRQFRNATNQKRAKLRSDGVNALQKKRRDFENAQRQKMRAFLTS